MKAEAGNTLLIVGPASFELQDGRASVLGAPLDSTRHVVTRGKQIPIEIHSLSSMKIHLGQDGSIEELSGSTIPLSWREAASTLEELEEGTTVVVGGVDTGKSTLCTFLCNSLIRQGRRVALVDADIGQADLGPPTTMGGGEVTRHVTGLSRIETSERLFIGLTSPSLVQGKVIHGVKKLVALHASHNKLVVLNTDGWVTGKEAISYKVEMLDELRPELTIGIGNGSDTYRILHSVKGTTLLAGSPDTIKERTRVDRKELRALGYQEYLSGSSLKTFRIDGVKLRSSLSSELLHVASLKPSRVVELKDRILGFLDEDDFLLEIGVLMDIVPSATILKAWSRLACVPCRIEIGEVKLNREGREQGTMSDGRRF